MSSTTVTSSSTDQPLNNAKNYICPKCNKPYDFQMVGNNFVGRIPLILNCKHSICQDCAYKMYASKDVICGECHTSNFISDVEAKKKPDQIFSVNYYVLGVLTYQKRYGYDSPSANFKPAGFQFSNPYNRRHDHKPSSFLHFNASPVQQNILSQFNVKLEDPQNVCSQSNCKNEAKVNCSDCDEIFCKQCSDTLHNAAKGLKKHKITALVLSDSLELTENCTIHIDALIEFCCETCQQYLCCYCILGEHNGHDFHQMTKMNDDNFEEFKSLVENAEEVLKKLLNSEKKVKYLLNKSSKVNNDTSIEITICKKIENAITKLQILEKELLIEAQQYKNRDRNSLLNVLENLVASIRSTSKLVSVSKEFINKRASPKKLNILLIRKQLEGVTSTACYFLRSTEDKDSNIEFLFDDSLIDDLQHSSKLKFSKSNVYSLVSKKDLPPDYEEEEIDFRSSPKSTLSSASSFIEEDVKSRKASKLDSVEKWVRSNTNTNTDINQRRPSTQREQDIEIPTFRKGARESVKVSHLTSPDCFYVQLRRMYGALHRLNTNITKYIKSQSAIMVQAPEMNALYLVKYISDGQIHWCRGRIVEEIPSQKMFVVFFVDYGNTTNVRKEDIIMIPSELKKQPPLAVECKFFDLYPVKGEWDPKALYLMTRIIADSELLMIVTDSSSNTLEVDLITMDCDTSVRDALKFLGYGIPYCKSPTELDRIKKELKNAENVKLYNKTEQYKKEESLEVIVSYVIDPYNIYVNLKNSRNDLTKLHEAMHNFYMENKKGYVYAPKEDMVVAVLYSDGISSSWRRGVITESTEGKGIVTARLVDIGMVISVPWDQIRKLDARFMTKDCQAKLVKMTHIVPPNGATLWPQNAIDFFTKYIKAETVLKMVISETSNPPEVLLFECFPNVHLCLNATLVNEGLAGSTGDLSTIVEWPQYGHEVQPKVDDTYTMSMMKTIQATNHEAKPTKEIDSDEEEYRNVWRKPIEVISAENPDLIYVRFTDNKEKFHEFQLELMDFYLKNKLTRADWEVEHVCVVHYKKKYYRGVILKIINKEKYLVSLRDIAITVEVKDKQLGMLNPRFTTIPEFAIRCHLADISPAGGTKNWPAMACEFLQDVLKKNNQLYLAKKGVVDKQRKSMPVIIWYMEILPGGALESSKTVMHSINKLLWKNGLALKSAVNKPNKKNGEKFDNAKQVDKKDTSGEMNGKVNKSDQEDDGAEEESIKSISTETEDHECSSSASASSVAGALQPSVSSKVDWNDLIEMQKQCPQQIIRDWIAPVPFKYNEFTAIPTFVNDDGEIFLHDTELEPLLKDMEKKMFEYFESCNDTEINHYWTPGEMCSVKYFVNKKWYRGKVLSVDGDEVKVVMVDYGNEDDCNVKDLSKDILYYDLPVFANKVVLHNVYPKENKWLTSDLDKLHAQIVEKEVTVYLKSQQIAGLPTPAVIKLDNLNINDLILRQSTNLSKLNRPRNTLTSTSSSVEVVSDSILDINNSQSDNDVIIEETASSSDENDVKDDLNLDDIVLSNEFQQSSLPDLEPDEKLKIVVINVLNYNKIIIETPPLENFEKEKESFENMSKDINLIAPMQPAIKSFEAGKACIAQYSEDAQWYRAQIIEEMNDNKLQVWFVDYGNFDSVNKDVVKEIQKEWLNVPIEQHVATIDGIVLTNENNLRQVLNEILSYIETVHMALIVSRKPLSVKLYKEGTNELSYQNLINSGLLEIPEKVQIEAENQEETIEDVESAKCSGLNVE